MTHTHTPDALDTQAPTPQEPYVGGVTTLMPDAVQDSSGVALELRSIRKAYKHFTALQQINLKLHHGELLCFLGPSGCGKTTLLRLIAGLDQADGGQILKQETDISRLKAEKRRCGIVFQNYALFPNLNIADNIAYGLHGRQWPKAVRQQRVQELLNLIGMADAGQKYPLQLSGGQQQRVALARALAPQPDILLLDEPLSALDARVRAHLRQEICLLQRRLQLPTILVTHDQEEALTMADRIVVMNHGVIEQIDNPQRIYQQPLTRFVAGFVGQMNFLAAVLVSPQELLVAGSIKLQLGKPLPLPVNASLEIGFRPESVLLDNTQESTTYHSAAHASQPSGLTMHARLEAQEFLGSRLRLSLSLQDGQQLLADVNALSVHQRGSMHMRVPEKDLHFFDQAGHALCY